MFKGPMESQYQKFIDMLSMIVARFDRPDTIALEVSQLARSHAGYGVKPEQYLAGRVIFGVETEPGKIKVTVNADDILIGALPGIAPQANVYSLVQSFNVAKLPTRGVTDILTHIWAKVIYNCALNAICSIHEIPYGKILGSEETREMMARVIRECYSVGLKKGIALDPPTAEAFIDKMIHKLIPSTAAHFPSMLQDLKRGKRTDIDTIPDSFA